MELDDFSLCRRKLGEKRDDTFVQPVPRERLRRREFVHPVSETGLGAARERAQMLTLDVDGYREEPRTERRAAIEVGATSVKLKKRLLKQVARVFAPCPAAQRAEKNRRV